MTSQTNLIAKLLKAEEEAESIVASARDGRTKALKDARTAANDEIEAFRAKEDAKSKEEMAKLDVQFSNKEGTANLAKELQQVKIDSDRNKEKTCKYMFDKVMNVETGLSQIQIQSLK